MRANYRLCVSKVDADSGCKKVEDNKISSTFFPRSETKNDWELGVLDFEMDYAYSDEVINQLIAQIKKAIKKVLKFKIKSDLTILSIGVGNPSFTADCFGVEVSKKISNILQTSFRSKNSKIRLCYFNPDIRAKTGLNTIDLINQVIKTALPDIIFIFDCFASKHAQKIGKCIQVKNTPLKPASAVCGYDELIDANGARVISIGAVLLGVKPASDLLVLKSNADLLTSRLSYAVSKAVSAIIKEL